MGLLSKVLSVGDSKFPHVNFIYMDEWELTSQFAVAFILIYLSALLAHQHGSSSSQGSILGRACPSESGSPNWTTSEQF